MEGEGVEENQGKRESFAGVGDVVGAVRFSLS